MGAKNLLLIPDKTLTAWYEQEDPGTIRSTQQHPYLTLTPPIPVFANLSRPGCPPHLRVGLFYEFRKRSSYRISLRIGPWLVPKLGDIVQNPCCKQEFAQS